MSRASASGAPPLRPVRSVDGRPKSELVASLIADEISREQLGAGAQLPGERELAAQLSVSRVTVRRALQALVDRGTLEKGGNGRWTVAREPFVEPTDALMSFTDLAERRGLRAQGRVLRAAVRAPSREEEGLLEVESSGKVFELVRLRILGDQPLALHSTVVPLWLSPGIDGLDFTDASLYAILRDRYGIIPARGDCTIRAIAATDEIAQLLDLPLHSPILAMRQVGFDVQGRPFEYASLLYRGDRYSFRGTLQRRRDVIGP